MRFPRILVLAVTICLACCGIAYPRSAEKPDKVDINHATVAELEHVPGMTHVWAERIVRFRPYRTKLDLVQQGILPATVYSRIREEIVAHHKDN